MARSLGKLLSGSSREIASLPLTQAVLTGIKRGINFFVVTEEDLVQAGVDFSYSHLNEIENPGTLIGGNGESAQGN